MRRQLYILIIIPIVMLAGCAAPDGAAPQPTRQTTTAPSATVAPPTPTDAPTDTPPSSATPSATAKPSSTATPSSTASPEPTATPTATATETTSPTATPTPAPTATYAPLGPATLGAIQQFELLGHNALGSLGWWGALALHDHYAYVGNYKQTQVSIAGLKSPFSLR